MGVRLGPSGSARATGRRVTTQRVPATALREAGQGGASLRRERDRRAPLRGGARARFRRRLFVPSAQCTLAPSCGSAGGWRACRRSGPAAVVVTRALRGAVQLVDAARRAPCDLLMNGMWTRPRTHLVCVRVAVHRVRVVVGCLLPVARATALAAVAFPRELARPALLLGGKYAWRRVRSRRSCELCGRQAHACLGEGGDGGGERCTASMALSARS